MIKLLILGAGTMARLHAIGFGAIDDVEIVAAVDTEAQNLARFAEEFGVSRTFSNLDDAIAWGEFDAAANVTPDNAHHATTMALLSAGKHVLCEKPLAMNFADAEEMTKAAEARGVVNLVNLTLRPWPATAAARSVVDSGVLGPLRHFDASYLQSWLVGQHWGNWRTERRWLWRLSSAHGSHGAVGDIGIHIIDAATYVAREDIVRVQGRAKTFGKAEGERIGEYVLDANDSFTMEAELESGAVGVIHATRWATGFANDLRLDLCGTKGGLRLEANGDDSRVRICVGDDVHTQVWREVDCPPAPSNYEHFATSIRTGKMQGPTFRVAAKLQKILDLLLASGSGGHSVL